MGPKKEQSPEVLVHEDVFVRCKKMHESKPQPSKPKGDITMDDLSIPVHIQTLPEIKLSVQYWQNGGTVKYAERSGKWPTNGRCEDQSEHAKVPKLRKEVQDYAKTLKGMLKTAEKVKNSCFKQYEKCETKHEKRQGIQTRIRDLENEINDDLRKADSYAKKRKLFATKWMYGSKLGVQAPRNNVAIVAEVSDKMSEWTDEAKDDVAKFFQVIEKMSDTFNCYLLGGSVVPYKPQYQQTFSKTGSTDCLKWFGKNFTAKAGQGSSWPPDWAGLLHTLLDDECVPSSIHIVCSKPPQPCHGLLDHISEVRRMSGAPIPVNVVTYDPEVDADANATAFFKQFAGEGDFMVDTTKMDMDFVDKILAAVKTKKKQLEKLHKQLDKVEDVSGNLETNRKILQAQIALEKFVRNDLELLDVALKRPAQPA